MTLRPAHPASDDGVATVWAAVAAAVIMAALLLGLHLGAAVVARHRAEAAADLAALAAAGHAVHGADAACRRAGVIAERMGGAIARCLLSEWDALVEVHVPVPLALPGTAPAVGRARAGPGEPDLSMIATPARTDTITFSTPQVAGTNGRRVATREHERRRTAALARPAGFIPTDGAVAAVVGPCGGAVRQRCSRIPSPAPELVPESPPDRFSPTAPRSAAQHAEIAATSGRLDSTGGQRHFDWPDSSCWDSRPTTRRSTVTLVVAAEPMGDGHWRHHEAEAPT